MIYGDPIIFGSGGGGSGPSASDAILTVTVPTGATVTMTKGGVTLTPTMWVQAADATLDCALFVIGSSLFDSQNAWTVTATRLGTMNSKSITIDSNEQYSLDIPLSVYFISNGAKVGDNPFAKYGSIGTEFTVDGNVAFKTDSQNAVFYSTYAVDMTGYSAMTVVIPKASFKYYIRFGLTSARTAIAADGSDPNPFEAGSTTIGTGTTTVTNITTDTTVNFDISNVFGSAYLGFTITYTGSGITSPFGKGGFAVKDFYLH